MFYHDFLQLSEIFRCLFIRGNDFCGYSMSIRNEFLYFALERGNFATRICYELDIFRSGCVKLLPVSWDRLVFCTRKFWVSENNFSWF